MTTYTAEQITSIGGNLWERGTKRRVYLNDWPTLIGLDIERYNTGNIRHATLDGETISNSRAHKLLGAQVYWENGSIWHTIDHAADAARVDGDELVTRLMDSIAKAVSPDLTTREAAEQLGVSVRTVQRWAKSSKVSGRKDARGRWVISL